jgi:diacylglycerol kinase (ATP)
MASDGRANEGGARPALAYVANPVAGHGRAGAVIADLALAAGGAGFGGPVLVTKHPGHATELARHAIEAGATMVVAVGGDGTAGEVAGALSGTDVTLGILPAGGGNDLARVFGIGRLRAGPVAIANAIRQLVVARTDRLDVALVNGMTSLQASGAGLDAHVTEVRSRSRVRPPTLSYAIGAVTGLLSWRTRWTRVTVDGKLAHEGPTFAVTVANTSTYGGGLQIAPGADPTDGYLDVAIIGDIGRFDALRLFPSVYRGGHVGHPAFRLVRGTHVLVESDDNRVPLHVDGTVAGFAPLEARVVAGAVSVTVPAPEWVSHPVNERLHWRDG